MNASSRTTTASDDVTYDCPDWCTRTDHHADEIDADNPPYHYGPDFGGEIIAGARGTDGEREVQILEPIAYVGAPSAAGLRKLAADALAAAEWLEARA